MCTNQELTSFVANISLFTRGKGPEEQESLRSRMNEAMDVLKGRGITEVAIAHWNFGSAGREPEQPNNNGNRYDPDWYKRPSSAQNVMGTNDLTVPVDVCVQTIREERVAAIHQKYLDYLVRFERRDSRKGWTRYLLLHPLTAMLAFVKGCTLPDKWRQQPLSETEYIVNLCTRYFGRMTQRD